jgi:hypothetical protein
MVDAAIELKLTRSGDLVIWQRNTRNPDLSAVEKATIRFPISTIVAIDYRTIYLNQFSLKHYMRKLPRNTGNRLYWLDSRSRRPRGVLNNVFVLFFFWDRLWVSHDRKVLFCRACTRKWRSQGICKLGICWVVTQQQAHTSHSMA